MPGVEGMRNRKPNVGARALVWRSIRVLGQFTISEVVAVTEARQENVQRYLRGLHRAGYLRLTKLEIEVGMTGPRKIFRLIRNTGPKAPRAGKKGIHDPNTRAFHPYPETTP